MSDLPCIKDIIERDGEYIGTPHGDSMWPLLHNKRDTIHVVKKTDKLNKHDVALYIRKNGQYVLHRIMKIENNSYTMCGDSQYVLEKGIQEDQIIGVLKSFYRNDRYCDTNKIRYKIYVFIWCLSPKIRRFLMRFVAYAENKKNKIKSRGKAKR